jgi:hypothetical protein
LCFIKRKVPRAYSHNEDSLCSLTALGMAISIKILVVFIKLAADKQEFELLNSKEPYIHEVVPPSFS